MITTFSFRGALAASALMAATAVPALAASIDGPVVMRGALKPIELAPDVPSAGIDPVVTNADAHPHGPGGTRVSGHVGALVGYSEFGDDGVGEDIDGVIAGLRGSINVNTGAFNVQLDAAGRYISVEELDGSSIAGRAHAYYRPDGAGYAVGAFAGVEYLTEESGILASLGLDETATDVIGGVEAAFISRFATLYARAGYGEVKYEGESADRYLVEGGVRFYPMDSLRFDIGLGLNRVADGDAHADLTRVSAVATYRPSGHNYSIFGGYRHDRASFSSPAVALDGGSANTVFAGAKLHFGTTSLREEDATGALWGGPELLP